MKSLSILIISLFCAVACAQAGGTQGIGSNSTSGKGGSTARFAISGEHLYALAGSDLITFSLENPAEPVALNKIMVAWDVETVFPYGSSLYLGARTGMYVYDLSQADRPLEIGRHSHQRACDPVVVQGDHAFVTLKAGGACGGSESVLEVLDIRDPQSPKLISSLPMFEPTGLAIQDTELFVCDGAAGLKIFDASDPLELKLKDTVLGHQCNDLIPQQDLLIASTDYGIWQYRNTAGQLELLSILHWQGNR